jgi:hypothetical protein
MLCYDRKSTKNVFAVEEEKCDHLSNVDRWIEILTEVAKMKAHINHGLDYKKGEEDDDKSIEYEYDGDNNVDDEYDDNDYDDISQELNDVLIDIKQGEQSDHTRKRSNVKQNSDIESSSIPDLVSFTKGSFSNDHRSSIGTSNIPLEEEEDQQEEIYEDSISCLDETASYCNSICTNGRQPIVTGRVIQSPIGSLEGRWTSTTTFKVAAPTYREEERWKSTPTSNDAAPSYRPRRF